MTQTTLVMGGCRSGKSRHALVLATRFAAKRKTFIATCEPQDEEMRLRVAKHKAERDPGWLTVEAPVDLPGAITKNSPTSDVILVDCLTLWTSNLLMAQKNPDAVLADLKELEHALREAACPVILVSNEVGSGVVPENKLARRFRDTAGWVNQKVAALAGRVIWMVAGIPVPIKP